MPSPRDITGELTRLPKDRLKSSVAIKEKPAELPLRAMAFDPVIWLTGFLLLGAISIQFALIIWMW